MKKNKYYSVSEYAKLLNLSRHTVYQRIRAGHIKPHIVGGHYFVPAKYVVDIEGAELSKRTKDKIARVVKTIVRDYGETLRLLGNE